MNYSKHSLNRPTTGPTLNGPFKEVVGLGSLNMLIYNGNGWDRNKAIAIDKWWICGGGRLERFYCTW